MRRLILLLLSQLIIPFISIMTVAGFAGEKPNIIVILSDDQGYGDASSYKNPGDIKTPNIDQLARRCAVDRWVCVCTGMCTITRRLDVWTLPTAI
jgi:hypothetical protein